MAKHEMTEPQRPLHAHQTRPMMLIHPPDPENVRFYEKLASFMVWFSLAAFVGAVTRAVIGLW
jgi:hypothetical protein